MNGKKLLPFGKGKLVERRHSLDAGVANKDVEAAEGLHRFGHAGLDLLLGSRIHGDADGATLRTTELRSRRFGAGLV